MAIRDVYSPILHRVDQGIRWRAIHPTEPIPPPYEILTKYSKPPADLLASSEKQLKKLTAAAGVKKGKRHTNPIPDLLPAHSSPFSSPRKSHRPQKRSQACGSPFRHRPGRNPRQTRRAPHGRELPNQPSKRGPGIQAHPTEPPERRHDRRSGRSDGRYRREIRLR